MKCARCGTVRERSELTKSGGKYVCKDKPGCDHDKLIRDRGGDPGPRSLQNLFRF